MRGTERVIVLQAWSYEHLGIGEGEKANAVASVNPGTQGDGKLPPKEKAVVRSGSSSGP